jgi:imidazolonepropionase-like amidohydrolase
MAKLWSGGLDDRRRMTPTRSPATFPRRSTGGASAVLCTAAVMLVLCGDVRAADLLVRRATLIDGTGAGPNPHTDVLVRAGRVVAVGTQLDARGAPILDANGAFLIPGLVDAHVHVGTAPGSAQRGDSPEQLVTLRRAHLRAYLAAGVTTVLDCGSAPETARDLRTWLASGHAGPRLLLLAPTFVAPGGYLAEIVPPLRTPDEVAERLAAAESLAPTGVKVMLESGFGPRSDWPVHAPQLRGAIVAEAERRGLPVFVHANKEQDKRLALEMRPRAIVHTGFYDEEPSAQFTRDMAASGAFLMTTFSVIDAALTQFHSERLDDALVLRLVPAVELATARDPASVRAMEGAQLSAAVPWLPRWLHPVVARFALGERAQLARLRSAQRAARLLADAGVPIVLGTDGGNWPVDPFLFHGVSTSREASLLADAGFSPENVLAAATRTPARMLGLTGEIGTIEVGGNADFVLLRKNPLRTARALRAVAWVVQGGVAKTPRAWLASP